MDADWALVLLTVALAGITGFYAWRTHDLAKSTATAAQAAVQSAERAGESVKVAKEEVDELREQRIRSSQPLVVAVIENHWGGTPDNWTLDVILENVGTGPALEVKLQAWVGGSSCLGFTMDSRRIGTYDPAP